MGMKWSTDPEPREPQDGVGSERSPKPGQKGIPTKTSGLGVARGRVGPTRCYR